MRKDKDTVSVSCKNTDRWDGKVLFPAKVVIEALLLYMRVHNIDTPLPGEPTLDICTSGAYSKPDGTMALRWHEEEVDVS